MYDIHKKLDSVAVIALGPSMVAYVGQYKNHGCKKFTDEVWTINHGGFFLKDIDAIIAMDDMRWKAEEYGPYIPNLSKLKVPIITAQEYSEYETSVTYPIEEVLGNIPWVEGILYLNNSCAYAIALALYRRCKTIWLFGYDFNVRPEILNYRQEDPWWRIYHLNVAQAGEPGEAAVTFLCGIAQERGVEIKLGTGSQLFDRDIPTYLYGYMDDQT